VDDHALESVEEPHLLQALDDHRHLIESPPISKDEERTQVYAVLPLVLVVDIEAVKVAEQVNLLALTLSLLVQLYRLVLLPILIKHLLIILELLLSLHDKFEGV